MRVALRLLVFFARLLDRHHLALPPFLANVEIVGSRDGGDHRQHQGEDLDPDLLEIHQDHDRVGRHHRVEPVALGPAHSHHDGAHNHDLDQPLAEIDQRIGGEQALGAANG
ncbi:hypothetical protein D3C87_1902540 [compost metagenome]